ncbi:MAG: GTPase HflX [Calditrichia bacterium]
MYIPQQYREKEKALLAGVSLPGQVSGNIQENMRELQQLARTAGLEVVDSMVQDRQQIHPAFYIGGGKVNELKQRVQSEKVDVVIFDDDLGPAQIRNLEKQLSVKIIDRSSLILDIFARHARTREAKTQVELAQLQHLLPRLTRQWTHLSRQVGGIGTRGPGETQLETDRRLIRKRIEKLRVELGQIDRQRATRRKNRQGIFRCALIGYTNVGKSTLMNLLSGSEVLVENQLFATLDSTVRKVYLNSDHQLLLSDTVGFIRKLPTQLVASFKSTLDEVMEADLLLHVVDTSHPHFPEQMQTVMSVLEELQVHHKPVLIVFNKIDRLEELGLLQSLKKQYPQSVFVSAVRHIGVERLKQKLLELVEQNFVREQLTVPVAHQKFLHYIHHTAAVEEQKYLNSAVEITFRCDPKTYQQIMQRYRQIKRKARENLKSKEQAQ